MSKKIKIVYVVYNSSAGTGDSLSEKDIVKKIEAKGFNCKISSSKKKDFLKVSPATDLVVAAGGDGTIGKTILTLLNKKIKYKRPVALLPLGTANNIATSLGISANLDVAIASWTNPVLKKFDVGQVLGLHNKPDYFIEAFGFGLFPNLMRKLARKNHQPKTPEDEFKLAINTLIKLVDSYKGAWVKVEIDGAVIEKKCVLVEVMNIFSLGPRLKLSPSADSGDGYFDVVLVEDGQRNLLKKYLKAVLKNEDAEFPIAPLRAQKMKMQWNDKHVHSDDEFLRGYTGDAVEISVLRDLIEIIN